MSSFCKCGIGPSSLQRGRGTATRRDVHGAGWLDGFLCVFLKAHFYELKKRTIVSPSINVNCCKIIFSRDPCDFTALCQNFSSKNRLSGSVSLGVTGHIFVFHLKGAGELWTWRWICAVLIRTFVFLWYFGKMKNVWGIAFFIRMIQKSFFSCLLHYVLTITELKLWYISINVMKCQNVRSTQDWWNNHAKCKHVRQIFRSMFKVRLVHKQIVRQNKIKTFSISDGREREVDHC